MHRCLSKLAAVPDSAVQIWTARVDSISAAELEELNGLLDSTEQARAARYHFEKDRHHYIAARGLLRCLLGSELETAPSGLVFDYAKRGKPSLTSIGNSDHALRFNVSHSSSWMMVALTSGREVGIDLESGSRLDRSEDGLSGLAARVLSPRELSIWLALPDAATREAAFLRAWTRKEAYAKATGAGLFDELNKIEVALDAATPEPSSTLSSSVSDGEEIRTWKLYDLPAPRGFTAALAVEQNGAN